MLSSGSIIRAFNRDLPVEALAPWTDDEERIFRAIQYEGGDRMSAIRAYRRNPALYFNRRFCADVTGGDWHFLPESSFANQRVCNSSCRAALSA
jgi:hypothetical protein